MARSLSRLLARGSGKSITLDEFRRAAGRRFVIGTARIPPFPSLGRRVSRWCMSLFMDKALAQRLERTEGAINRAFVEARARLDSGSRAAFRDFSGTYAMFDGP